MRIIIDIGHPAHVHYFKNFAANLVSKDNLVLFTCREKEVTIELLKSLGLNYISLGKPFKTIPGKIWGLIFFNLRILSISLKFKPDILLSAGSLYTTLTTWLLGKPHITLEDTGNMEQVRLYLPFSKAVLTPASFHRDLGRRQIRINTYHELAYLYPGMFNPDKGIKNSLGLKPDEKFVIMRFVSWDASHDIGNKGISTRTKRKLIDIVGRKYKIFISSEEKLPTEFEKYMIHTPAHKIHDVLYAAEMYIGEGATMASECAMLGTPAVYVNPMYAGTIKDQENNGLVFHFISENGIIEKIEELLNIPDLKNNFKSKKDLLLSDKVNYSEFLIWFIEKWPESFKIMEENPEYQERFR